MEIEGQQQVVRAAEDKSLERLDELVNVPRASKALNRSATRHPKSTKKTRNWTRARSKPAAVTSYSRRG